MVGLPAGREPRRQSSAEKPDWRSLPHCGRTYLSRHHAPAISEERVETHPSLQRIPDRPADRRALAHSGGASKPTLFRSHLAQRSRRVSRLSVVLLHERTGTAFSEPAFAARLQHGPTPVVLA